MAAALAPPSRRNECDSLSLFWSHCHEKARNSSPQTCRLPNRNLMNAWKEKEILKKEKKRHLIYEKVLKSKEHCNVCQEAQPIKAQRATLSSFFS